MGNSLNSKYHGTHDHILSFVMIIASSLVTKVLHFLHSKVSRIFEEECCAFFLKNKEK